ncbi:MAG: hypothetical protein ABS35_37610 [Kaistia sp. SCN 65-12]|nr:MAG: hypothetical protein ABS35_37610 [Kaistia sp. SCN 65-12]
MRRRYEVSRGGNGWSLGTGGSHVTGFRSVGEALGAAMASAHEAEESGEHISIYLLQHGQETQVYQSRER